MSRMSHNLAEALRAVLNGDDSDLWSAVSVLAAYDAQRDGATPNVWPAAERVALSLHELTATARRAMEGRGHKVHAAAVLERADAALSICDGNGVVVGPKTAEAAARLAAALREVYPTVRRLTVTFGPDEKRSRELGRAIEALAAYDAQVSFPAPATPETITIQEAWEAAGGNPGIKASRQELLDALKAMDEAVDESPRIGIRMEGGVIQSVFTDREATVYVIDYDVEDAAPLEGYEDENQGVCELEQDDGQTEECVLSRHGAEQAAHWFPRMDAALQAHAERLNVEPAGMTP